MRTQFVVHVLLFCTISAVTVGALHVLVALPVATGAALITVLVIVGALFIMEQRDPLVTLTREVRSSSRDRMMQASEVLRGAHVHDPRNTAAPRPVNGRAEAVDQHLTTLRTAEVLRQETPFNV